ncbi:MAG: putative lipid II flippase FtsW [Oscillospiraceae bacterium]|nr:putative lipid II flippase FtsW [Oscillospiraceae bacterium]
MAGEAAGRDMQGRLSAPQKRVRFSLFNIKAGGVDLTFLILVMLLLSIGLVMLFSASYPNALYYRGNSFFFIINQLVFAVAGVVLMMLVTTVNYKVLQKFAWPIMWVTVALLAAVFAFPAINNAQRWIHTPFFNIQPSEIAKFAVVILFAKIAVKNYDKMHTFRYGVQPFLPILLILSGLIVMQPHLSGTILVLAIGAIMMICGGTNMKWFVFAALLGIAGIAGLIMVPGMLEHATVRLATWQDPFSDPRGAGFQTIQSLLAIGSGGLMGVGIGNSRQKFLYLPEPQNDFIFSIVSEELGFIGASLIILLFALLVWRGFVIGMRCRDRFGSLVAVGLTAQVGLQTVLNIMVVTNTIPNTGVSLPFFSYGGSSLVMLLCQMGVVLAISRQTTMEKS